jgi:hypothetical protein
MKKFLLIVLVLALSEVSAEMYNSRPNGEGVYIVPQMGGGVLILSADGKLYVKHAENNGRLLEGQLNRSYVQPLPSLQLNWGYSHRFDSNATLGFEATVLSPAVRLGYMINDRHHIAVGVHYALIARLILNYAVDYVKDELTKQGLDRASFSLDLDALSGIGGSLSYEYFTESKNFFRLQVRADYYSAQGKVGNALSLTNVPIKFAIDGKGAAWDIMVGVGFGSQW